MGLHDFDKLLPALKESREFTVLRHFVLIIWQLLISIIIDFFSQHEP